MRLAVFFLLWAAAGTVIAAEASHTAPGGLPREITPQFVLFTHDDALTQLTYDAMRSVTDGRTASNGCPVSATYFTTNNNTDCLLLRKVHQQGHEVAGHTITHRSALNISDADLRDELLGGRRQLAACGIPESDVVGARAPYLETRPEMRRILWEDGFLYDSTLIEEVTGHSLSRGPADRIWPWDMGTGVPINTEWFGSFQRASRNESWPGLWQVPVWDLAAAGGPYTMDYGADGRVDVFAFLKANFEYAYGGNRAPLPIYIHTPWLLLHRDALLRFVDYALSKPDVYFVTMRQLIAWMKNPVPAGQLTPAQLGCGNPGGAGPSVLTPFNLNWEAGKLSSATPGASDAAPAPVGAQAATRGATEEVKEEHVAMELPKTRRLLRRFQALT